MVIKKYSTLNDMSLTDRWIHSKDAKILLLTRAYLMLQKNVYYKAQYAYQVTYIFDERIKIPMVLFERKDFKL